MRQATNVFCGGVLALSLIGGGGVALGGQRTGRTPPPLLIPSVAGGDLFRFYCASCHGRDGKGDGPVASALNQRPPDLTTIARRNRGRFPTERVEGFVTGDREPTIVHGSADMPVWGPIFQALDSDNRMNRIRIENVVAFIQSIQTN